MCCDYPSLQNQHVFAESEGSGAPDGSCVDEMGYLWNAEWGGTVLSVTARMGPQTLF